MRPDRYQSAVIDRRACLPGGKDTNDHAHDDREDLPDPISRRVFQRRSESIALPDDGWKLMPNSPCSRLRT